MLEKHYEVQNLANYLGKFHLYKNKIAKCYTKKQLRAIFPKNKCNFAGEYKFGNTKNSEKCIADLSLDDYTLYLNKYKLNNRIIYAEKGYLKCTDNSLIVLLKNVFIKRLVLFILSAFLLFSAGAAIYNIYAFRDTVNKLLNIDPNANDWDNNLNAHNNNSKGTKIPGFGLMTIPKDKTNINISLGNPEENSCYFIISLYLKDGTELFKSELIPPGKGLSNVNLSKSLGAGEYDAIVKYQTFDLETQKEMNGADMNIKLIVK